MRWLLARDPGSCDVCGADLERGADWCGACGAHTDTPGDGAGRDGVGQPVVAAESDAAQGGDHAAGPRWSRRSRVVVAALVLVGVAVAIAAQPRSGPSEPLLGQLDQQAGLSATGPPPSGLRLAWAHEPEAPSSGGSRTVFGPPRDIVVGDGRIRLGGDVIDLVSGQLVRVAAAGGGSGPEWATVEAGELVVLDQLTGEVLHRAAVAGDWADRNAWNRGRWSGVSLFGVEHGSVLVADDGSVIAEVEGSVLDHIDRVLGDAAAFPVRSLAGGPVDEHFTAPVRLVATATGEVVLALDDARARVVDVVGDVATVAETEARTDAFLSPAATAEVPWTVRLLDARTGEERARLEVASHEPPRLLGTFGDGTAVIAARSGDEYPLWAVAPDGSVSTFARAQSPPRRGDGPMWLESASVGAAVMTGGVLVISAGSDGLVALDRTGRALWRLDASSFTGLRAGGGHVAVLPDTDGGRIRVVRAADGEVVASRSTRTPRWDTANTPHAALAGTVGLGLDGAFNVHGEVVGAMTWLDLRTGEPVTLEEAIAPFLPGDDAEVVDRSWLLHGTLDTRGEDTGAGGAERDPEASEAASDGIDPIDPVEPVMTRYRPDGVLELLEPGEGLTRFSLPGTASTTEDVGLIGPGGQTIGRGIRSLGGDADRMAVWSDGFEHPNAMATHVLDRRTGEVTTIPGMRGIALVGDLLLAIDVDPDHTIAALVGIDAATGQERWSGPPLEALRGLYQVRIDRDLLVDPGVTRVTARSMRDGAPAWTHSSDTELSSHSVLGPRHVVVATTAGEVVALDRTDGTVAWRTPVGVPVASMTGAGGHVLVGTYDGLVVHLDGRGREVQRIVVGSGPVEAVAALGDTVVATVDQRVVGLRVDGTGITSDDEVDLP